MEMLRAFNLCMCVCMCVCVKRRESKLSRRMTRISFIWPKLSFSAHFLFCFIKMRCFVWEIEKPHGFSKKKQCSYHHRQLCTSVSLLLSDSQKVCTSLHSVISVQISWELRWWQRTLVSSNFPVFFLFSFFFFLRHQQSLLTGKQWPP